MPQLRHPRAAEPIVPRAGTQSRGEQEPLDFMSSKRIRMNIRAVLDDNDLWLTAAYSLALQAEHLLQVVEGKRTHEPEPEPKRSSGRTFTKWGVEGRAALFADPRSNEELAVVYGVSRSAIYQQRRIARMESVA